MKSDTPLDRKAKSGEMKFENAKKGGLSELEKEVYLRGLVSLGKARSFVRNGNQKRGFKPH